jgi:hypothetical protein
MASKDKGPATPRSSKTGKFVTPDYAKKHPSTTETEHNRPKPKKK